VDTGEALETSAAALAGLAPLRPLTTAYTISVDGPEAMAAKAAAAARTMPLLKLKLAGADPSLHSDQAYEPVEALAA
jgi:L-alanine-DL-glutamate epimerase-like enolase superfamily enzyme